MTVYLLESQGVRVLADSGIADQPMGRHDLEEHSQLLVLMEQEGIDPASIDYVVHTHLHFDHVGWNTRPGGDGWAPTFPNAKHLIQRPDWEHWVGHRSWLPRPRPRAQHPATRGGLDDRAAGRVSRDHAGDIGRRRLRPHAGAPGSADCKRGRGGLHPRRLLPYRDAGLRDRVVGPRRHGSRAWATARAPRSWSASTTRARS